MWEELLPFCADESFVPEELTGKLLDDEVFPVQAVNNRVKRNSADKNDFFFIKMRRSDEPSALLSSGKHVNSDVSRAHRKKVLPCGRMADRFGRESRNGERAEGWNESSVETRRINGKGMHVLGFDVDTGKIDFIVSHFSSESIVFFNKIKKIVFEEFLLCVASEKSDCYNFITKSGETK